MIEIVIIGQNEGKHVKNMLQSLKHYPCKRLWVLDRCTDDSENQLKEFGESYVKTDDSLYGRQTSHARNLGLSLCDRRSDILFLDGDRYIAEGSLEGLSLWNNDIALLTLEKESRNSMTDYRECYGQVFNSFFSCGIFIKREAINRILEFQQGELFCEELQDQWGIEDTYLGDVCYHLGLTAGIYRGCKLKGEFEKFALDTAHVMIKRFAKRDNLKVKW